MLIRFCSRNPLAIAKEFLKNHTSSINDCNTSLGKDAMNRVSTNGLFVFFQIGITIYNTIFWTKKPHLSSKYTE
ncbi:hypothetical protein CDG76_05750 [Nostoc sp. 'Peltigera membranacea cyanobiont' 210A]|nr:hypothetical protein CDG76_05750 [Nostoc sp. 'Peltigera membranacea cyanobiont' 210A]